ncbi:MAG: polyprenyl synthetase family protein [Bacteroidota bacterium]
MYHFEEIQRIIQKTIAAQNFVHEPEALYEPISYSLNTGGKRLRPALLLMAANLYTSDIESFLMPAIGVEIFHNFTLVHDDIMDKASVRRNKPTVHAKWDTNTAILSGDAMFIRAYDFIFDYAGRAAQKVYRVFNQSALRVCEGQQYDMNFETTHDVSEQQYLRMIELKTAELIACSLKMGALIGGTNDGEADTLFEFGKNLGMAFQLQDDYLDSFGDEQAFGKNIGGDILSDKKTYLLIKAYEKSDKADRDRLDQLIGNKQIDPQSKVRQVKEIYLRQGIKQLTADKAEEYFKFALITLNQISKSDEVKKPLQDLAFSMIKRKK